MGNNIEMFSFFCEDFRKEFDGRCSAMGIYSAVGQMFEFPYEVSRLSLVAYVTVPKEIETCAIEMRLKCEGVSSESTIRETFGETVTRGDIPESHPFWQVVSEFDLGSLSFSEGSSIRATITAGTAKSKSSIFYVGDCERGGSTNKAET